METVSRFLTNKNLPPKFFLSTTDTLTFLLLSARYTFFLCSLICMAFTKSKMERKLFTNTLFSKETPLIFTTRSAESHKKRTFPQKVKRSPKSRTFRNKERIKKIKRRKKLLFVLKAEKIPRVK